MKKVYTRPATNRMNVPTVTPFTRLSHGAIKRFFSQRLSLPKAEKSVKDFSVSFTTHGGRSSGRLSNVMFDSAFL
jgi:hypothetical protein